MMYEGAVDRITMETPTGARKLVPHLAADWLREQNAYLTVSGTGELLLYDKEKGMWAKKAEEQIKNTLQLAAKPYLNRVNVSEVIDHIRRSDYAETSRFNSRAGYINLHNGVYCTETDELIEHDPDLLFTYSLPFDYDPKAECIRFTRFMHEVCQDDEEMETTIWEGIAYTFMPGMPIQRAMMLVGSGANGKSTLLGTLRELAGQENVASVPIQALQYDKKFVVANLRGKLLNITADIPPKGLTETGLFKALIGGDAIDAELKFVQDHVTFRNSAKLWFSANQIPRADDDTDAYYRRWNVLEFQAKFPEGKDILPSLTTPKELAGIFNIAMTHLKNLEKNLRYTYAKDVERTRRDYLKSADTVKLFTEEMLVYDPASNLPKSTIYEAYSLFCKENGLVSVGREESFWRLFRKRAVYYENSPVRGGERHIKGYRLAERDLATGSTPQSTLKQQVQQVNSSLLLNISKSHKKEDKGEPVAPVDPAAPGSSDIPTSPPPSSAAGGAEASPTTNPVGDGAALSRMGQPITVTPTPEYDPDKNPSKNANSVQLAPILTWEGIQKGLRKGLPLGHNFDQAPEQYREALRGQAIVGEIFEPTPGIWKSVAVTVGDGEDADNG